MIGVVIDAPGPLFSLGPELSSWSSSSWASPGPLFSSVTVIVAVIVTVVVEREVAGTLVGRPVVVVGNRWSHRRSDLQSRPGRHRGPDPPYRRRRRSGVWLEDGGARGRGHRCARIRGVRPREPWCSRSRARPRRATPPPPSPSARSSVMSLLLQRRSDARSRSPETKVGSPRLAAAQPAGKGGGKPQSSSPEPSEFEPEPELSDPEPELSEPEPGVVRARVVARGGVVEPP